MTRPEPRKALIEGEPLDAEALLKEYRRIRAVTESLCAPLQTEDYVVQGAPEASPPKWHLAHTTWFFETFALAPSISSPRYGLFDPRFQDLFNSYYNTLGEPLPRSTRGLSRPTVREVLVYRKYVDDAIAGLLEKRGEEPRIAELLEWGLQHEQQHQELLLMDILRNFSVNPLRPAYLPPDPVNREEAPLPSVVNEPACWIDFTGGNRNLGHGGEGFGFDNEFPRHLVYLAPYALADRLVTCGEYLAFMEDGGYGRPELWLSDGWEHRARSGWEAPLYWERGERGEDGKGGWRRFTLRGMLPVDNAAPVCHVSFYEADAFARWAGKRLPTEGEWENAVDGDAEWKESLAGANLLERAAWDALPTHASDIGSSRIHGLRQVIGDAWEWTQSAYAPYPGYRPPEGALGEYNGKFMNNQRVLRGGSFATPSAHIRPTYRNFYRPEDRWAFTGFRLCDDSATR